MRLPELSPERLRLIEHDLNIVGRARDAERASLRNRAPDARVGGLPAQAFDEAVDHVVAGMVDLLIERREHAAETDRLQAALRDVYDALTVPSTDPPSALVAEIERMQQELCG